MSKLKFGLLFTLLFLLNFITVKAQSLSTKKSIITLVFNKLVDAYGNAKAPPVLEIIPSKSESIAYYISSPIPTIKIDEEVYDICTKFGEDSLNALSIILSHELAHYYNDHNWCTDYAFALKLKISKEDKVTHEREADNFGLYHSCIAGYQPFHIYDKLIDKIYMDYKLKDINPGYPTKSERKIICKEAETKINELYPYFTKGLEEIQKKQFASAIQCFEILSMHFPSREIFNNLGVAQTLYVLEYKPIEKIEIDNIQFYYPLILDNNTRLHCNLKRNKKEINIDTLFTILKGAQHNFEKAIFLDPLYEKSYVNLGCVFDLMNISEAGIGILKQIPKKNINNYVDYYRIIGICYYHIGDKDKFSEFFELIK